MEEQFSKYDPTEYLTNEAEINAYLDEAMTIGEPNLLSAVLRNDITKTKCMVKSCSENGNNNNACL
jgi:DNA-binding phage protein